ncbi:ABC transporter ATP-binding protein [Haladaptatus pallidirubidus]|uniref:Dipeptide ABC transporter ATP-binding protein n=1 Tax=Haladaptatus pallidirubidus TaxID=1008152 RepID=A0AAV3UPK3_9EURY|nr:ABC transporter ATP-binding protein [Haladaptatus pallidirubidus]
MSNINQSETRTSSSERAVIEVRNLVKHFSLNDSFLDNFLGNDEYVEAVSDVSFSIAEGETLALVGESGSGKSTVANLVTGLYAPTSGQVLFEDKPIESVKARPADILSEIGMVFQDPKASLDPRLTIRRSIAEPLHSQEWNKQRREERVDELLDLVNLSDTHADRYPHELSGGQAQRVAIARAVALDPRVLVLDEPVSALDASVQAKILNLLMKLQEEMGLTYLFIAHDLNVIEHIADRVAVMYLGNLMEIAPAEQLFEQPTHPYTYTLLSAIPSLETGTTDGRIILEGDVPSPVHPPSGCVFHTRCPVAEDECGTTVPNFEQVDNAQSKCLFAQKFAEEYSDR